MQVENHLLVFFEINKLKIIFLILKVKTRVKQLLNLRNASVNKLKEIVKGILFF